MMDRFRLSCPEHPMGLATVGHFGPMTPITHQVSAQQIRIYYRVSHSQEFIEIRRVRLFARRYPPWYQSETATDREETTPCPERWPE